MLGHAIPMNRKSTAKKDNNRYHVDYPAMSNVASSTETTGLIATPPQSQEAYNSLLDNAGIETPKKE